MLPQGFAGKLPFSIKENDIPINIEDVTKITFCFNSIVKIYTKEINSEITYENNLFQIPFSSADTLSFIGANVLIQFVVFYNNGDKFPSNIMKLQVGELLNKLKEEVSK